MIRIPEFVDNFLTSEMRRGKVKSPHWFRVPVKDTPELQMLLHDHPNGVRGGYAILGLWEQIQKWCMAHWKRSGQFVMSNGKPMNIKQVAVALGLSADMKFLEESIPILVGIGWLEELEGAPVVPVPTLEEYTPDEEVGAHIREMRITQEDTGEYSSTLRYQSRGRAKELVQSLRDMGDCPLACENPRPLEDALCDAEIEGRDLDRIIKAMSLYYQTEQGTGKYRSRPHNFVRNRKDEEDWDSWFNEIEKQKIQAQLVKRVCVATGREDQFPELLARNRNKTITELIERIEKWEAKQQQEAG